MRFPWFRRGREKAQEHVGDFERLLRLEKQVEHLETTWIDFRNAVRSQLANAVKRQRRDAGDELEARGPGDDHAQPTSSGMTGSSSARDYAEARAMGLLGRRPR